MILLISINIMYRKFHIENEDNLLDYGSKVLEFIENENDEQIYANDNDLEKIDKYINKIMSCVDYEVKKHNYKPENFFIYIPCNEK